MFKKDKSVTAKFGGIIDAYTVHQAVKDKTVVPLLYEGRLARQVVNESRLDTFFAMVAGKIQDEIIRKEISTQAALYIDQLIQNAVLDNGKAIVDWQFKTNITGKLLIDIGDYLIDEVRDKYHINLTFGEMDEMGTRYIDVAKIRFK